MSCGRCKQNIATAGWDAPPCHKRPCDSSEFMLEELEAWIDFYQSISAPIIRETGVMTEIFQRSGVWDHPTLDILAEMDLVRIVTIKDKEKRERELNNAG